jgi:transcriptional regulator with XRE-family HTH domain
MYGAKMFYGERLKIATQKREKELLREITQTELANVAGCKPQNFSMIAKANLDGKDQTLNALAHARVCRFLKVNPDWLLEEVGEMDSSGSTSACNLTQAAQDIGDLFDTIPVTDRLKRINEFNAATTAILKVLQPGEASDS